MNIIFLDFDGVIRIYDPKKKESTFKKESLQWILQLCKKTNSKIVISSDWREDLDKEAVIFPLSEELKAYLHKDWCIPIKGQRPEEIQAWLQNHMLIHF